MLKLLILSLSLSAFAQEKSLSWQEAIAARRSINSLTVQRLNDDFKTYAKNPGVAQDNLDQEFLKFFYKEIRPYEDAAAKSIHGKTPEAALKDPEYNKFRNFILFSQHDPRLKDLLFEVLLRSPRTNQELITALKKDPTSEISSAFAKTFLRSQQRYGLPPDQHFLKVQDSMKYLSKEDVIAALKEMEKEEPKVKGLDPCNPQFWLIARVVGGHSKYGEAIQRFKNSGEDEHADRCTAAETIYGLSDGDIAKLQSDKNFRDSFWKKVTAKLPVSEDQRNWMQQTFKMLTDSGQKWQPAQQQLSK